MPEPVDVPGPVDEDVAFGGILRLSLIVGIPATFLVLVGLAVLGGEAVGTALAVAGLPALVAGPYFGGLAVLGRADLRRRSVEQATTPAEFDTVRQAAPARPGTPGTDERRQVEAA